MKLSDAIDMGAKMMPPGRDFFFSAAHGLAWISPEIDGPAPVAACPLGGALLARAGGWAKLQERLKATGKKFDEALEVVWPYLGEELPDSLWTCGCKKPARADWMILLCHLADDHNETAARLAELLRRLGK